jgi:hypothetical protein
MKKFFKKGVVLFIAAMALCAFVKPSMTGAATWSAIGSEHTLDSSNLGFVTSSSPLGAIDSQCTSSSFTATVVSPSRLDFTAVTFGGDCTAHGPSIGTCNMDLTAQKLPWTATALSSTDVQIHGMHITVVFTQTMPDTTCNIPGADVTVTGTVTGAWSNASSHLTLSNAEGLTGHSVVGPMVLTARGTLRDTSQTLRIT